MIQNTHKILKVTRIPKMMKVTALVRKLAWAVRSNLEVLELHDSVNWKDCFVRLFDNHDPEDAVRRILSRTKFYCFIPKYVPQLPPASKTGKLKMKTKRLLKIPTLMTYQEKLKVTQRELMRELQLKYTGLYNLSRRTGHVLLEHISRILHQRLKSIIDSHADTESCFSLSRLYRQAHPHFGDFQLILSTLHKMQDAAGHARTQLSEDELIGKPTSLTVVNNIPYEKVKSICHKYSDRISKKILTHIKSLNCQVNDNDTEDEVARKKVRAQLKCLAQYMPMMMSLVVSKQFIPQKAPYHKITLYGEPFLPSKTVMVPVTMKHKALRIHRSDRIFNMMKFNIPPKMFSSLIAMDGTVIGGAKLIIRHSDAPLYRPTKEFGQEMKRLYGVEIRSDDDDEGNDDDDIKECEDDDDDMKEWEDDDDEEMNE